MKPNAEAGSGKSNKEIGEFTNEYVAKHNKIPEPNGRKSSGEDRGTSGSNERCGYGDGEYDKSLNMRDKD